MARRSLLALTAAALTVAALTTAPAGTTPAHADDLPDSLDWRTSGAVQPVRDEGLCPDSQGCATAAALESASEITTGQHHNYVHAPEDGPDHVSPGPQHPPLHPGVPPARGRAQAPSGRHRTRAELLNGYRHNPAGSAGMLA
ncbi:C1 family peptidase [Kitasatospora sp. NPDC048540]|uniref:C1 family peptidase n=1 Tax=Kitasatospora sp. NPDC048540 TaxID=3155634 RepID=UPI003404986A